jgi:hypothetical protein
MKAKIEQNSSEIVLKVFRGKYWYYENWYYEKYDKKENGRGFAVTGFVISKCSLISIKIGIQKL